MPINAGKMEVLRDFWNTEHHRITKMEQVRQLTPLPIHLDAEIQLHYRIEKILIAYDNDDDDDTPFSFSNKKHHTEESPAVLETMDTTTTTRGTALDDKGCEN